MSADPALDLEALRRHLASAHGLEVDTLTFLSSGTLLAYRADGTSGRHFVKVVPETLYGSAAARRLADEGPLLRALHELGTPLHVPMLLPDRTGINLSVFGPFHIAVYTWIEAVNLGPDWEEALPELAGVLGHLHARTAVVTAKIPRLPVPPEDFALPFEAALLADIAALANLPAAARPDLLVLRDLVRPREAQVRRYLRLAHDLRLRLLAGPVSWVVCHADAHGGNVLRDSAGHLWIVDWETARLAPCEHDLWMLLVRRPEVLPLYRQASGSSVPLNPDVLSFYVLRRVLEDLAVDVQAVLRGHARPEDDAETLNILARFVVPAFDRAEQECAVLTGAVGLG